MKPQLLAFGAMSVLLAGCGVSTPEEVRGVWSDACPTGQIQVDSDTLHILYPSQKDFPLTASEFDGKTWKASFESDGKKITDIFILENGTLRADQVISDGTTFNSNKIKMTKCS